MCCIWVMLPTDSEMWQTAACGVIFLLNKLKSALGGEIILYGPKRSLENGIVFRVMAGRVLTKSGQNISLKVCICPKRFSFSLGRPCELHCSPKGIYGLYIRKKFSDKVIDGTKCYPEKRQVCIDGRCEVSKKQQLVYRNDDFMTLCNVFIHLKYTPPTPSLIKTLSCR